MQYSGVVKRKREALYAMECDGMQGKIEREEVVWEIGVVRLG